MVSPRKRILQASANTALSPVVPEDQLTPNLTKNSKVPQAFKDYKFFLDLKDTKARTVLIENIKSLGGQLEEFLSKEATHVISDCPLSEYPQNTTATSAGPPSPWTPTQTPSPATSNSCIAGSTERNTRRSAAGSRADSILSKVRAQGKSGGSSRHVLETALRLKLQIWSYSKTIAWLGKFKNKYGSLGGKSCGRSSRESGGESKNRRLLSAPCLKLEAIARSHQPVYAELKQWPAIHYTGRAGSCPYNIPSNKQKTKKLAKRLDLDRDQKKSVKKEQKTTTTSVRKARSGFCEICNCNYSDLEQHLISDQHNKYVNCSDNWKELEEFTSISSELLI